MTGLKTFKIRGVDGQGQTVSDQITAADRPTALRLASAKGLHVTALDEAQGAGEGPFQRRPKKASFSERVLILRQLAVMMRAGVDQLDAIETVARSVDSIEGRDGLRQVATALRRGETLAGALREAIPGYDDYVFALIEVGEASGRLEAVLADAADQLAAEERLRKDVATALTYPAFLLTAGIGAVLFLFYQVVPRFAAMIGSDVEQMTGLSGAVMKAGLFVEANILIVLIALGGLVVAGVGVASSAKLKEATYSLGTKLPVVSSFLQARERAIWTRSMYFSLTNGVSLMRATELSIEGLPKGRFRRTIGDVSRSLRGGQSIDEIFKDQDSLTAIDIGMLRAGQKSGSLAPIFGHMADRYEDQVRDTLKRTTALIEPLAIALVAILIGVVAFALMSALSSVYEQFA